ncbi:hypothetical protein [Treponema pedis]|uniref:Uncharacterized protein n=2 Tax=Treponema pedis TaxID=409322 RepID=A0A7S7AVV0_9SPIR|nr:hypothetical protein [Treponema pedis]QOW59961.1 hypothetical protein IFE08_08820 [Treponema pedis]
MNKIKIITRLNQREMTAREYISYCKNLLRNIKAVFPEMYLSILDDNDVAYFFKNDLSDFGEENLYKIIMEDKEIVYYNPDKNNEDLTVDSKTWSPFSSLFFLKEKREADKYSVSDISIDISQGSNDINDKIAVAIIKFSDNFTKRLNNSILEKIIYCLEKTGDLKFAVAISDNFRSEVKIKGQNLWIGYLTYFAHKDISRLFKDFKGIEVTETELGTLISLSNKFYLSEETVRKALAIRDILAEKGLMNL